MKRTLLPLLLLALALPAFAAPTLLSEAQHAYAAGDLDTAKAKFEEVLKTDPQNVTARNYLKMIAAGEKGGEGKLTVKALKALNVPSVDFKEASLDATLDALRKQAGKLSDGKIQPNFVVVPGVDSSTPVTLRLSNVPFTEVLRYVGEVANVQFEYGRHAISVKPKASKRLPESIRPGSAVMPVMPQ